MVDTISARYNASEHQHRTLTVDPAPQTLVLQLLLDLGRATGAVGPDIRGGVVIIEDLIRHLTVVHRGIAHVMVTHQLVTAVDTEPSQMKKRAGFPARSANTSWAACHLAASPSISLPLPLEISMVRGFRASGTSRFNFT